MSFLPLCASPWVCISSLSGSGKGTELFIPSFCRKEKKRRKEWEIARLIVPGNEKSNSAPGVVPVNQEILKKKKENAVNSVTIPKASKSAVTEEDSKAQRYSSETSCMPRIESSALEGNDVVKKRTTKRPKCIAEYLRGQAQSKGDTTVVLDVPLTMERGREPGWHFTRTFPIVLNKSISVFPISPEIRTTWELKPSESSKFNHS